MIRLLATKRWLGAITAALAASALILGSISAQTESVSPGCQLPIPPATQGQGLFVLSGQPTGATAAPSTLPATQGQGQFAQSLAQALNLPLATVQQALQSLPPLSPLHTPPTDPLAAAAAQLGVTQQQLQSAVETADQALVCPSSSGTIANPGHVDSAAFFTSVAQQLGPSFTGQQVEAAFVSTKPPLPDPTQIQAQIKQRFSDLASALGVTTDALTAALKSSGLPAGCMPLALGNVSVLGPPPPLPGPGSGSAIIIPLGGATQAGATAGFAAPPPLGPLSSGVGDSVFITSGGSASGVICSEPTGP